MNIFLASKMKEVIICLPISGEMIAGLMNTNQQLATVTRVRLV